MNAKIGNHKHPTRWAIIIILILRYYDDHLVLQGVQPEASVMSHSQPLLSLRTLECHAV